MSQSANRMVKYSAYHTTARQLCLEQEKKRFSLYVYSNDNTGRKFGILKDYIKCNVSSRTRQPGSNYIIVSHWKGGVLNTSITRCVYSRQDYCLFITIWCALAQDAQFAGC